MGARGSALFIYMKKYILIRGHQGSGKSTFAREQMAQFAKDYPDGAIFHLENDLEMTNEAGEYEFSPENFARAEKRVAAKKKAAFAAAQQQPAVLIVNSNTNQKALNCLKLIKEARKQGFQVEIYRLHNFYDNLHRVPFPQVVNAYLKLNENPLREEIHINRDRPKPAQVAELLDKLARFDFKNLPYDGARHSYLSDDYLLCGRANYRENYSKQYPQLRVLKYQNKVFYENRFDRALLEMRGVILDDLNQIIVRPFDKCFNYSERLAKDSPFPLHIGDDELVHAVVKVNGFLGCCSYIDLPPDNPSAGKAFNRQVLYSTTGSLDSSFSQLVREHCHPLEPLFKRYPNHCFLFEINDASDPHIIKEELGVTLIGLRRSGDGFSYPEDFLDQLAKEAGLRRPPFIKNISFGELKQRLAAARHEGFMVYRAADNELLCKMKSPYYLISKLFARTKNLEQKLRRETVDEEYYPLIDHLQAHQETFSALDEQGKIKFIQDYFHDYLLHL